MLKKFLLAAAFSLPLVAQAGGVFKLSSPDVKATTRIAEQHVFNGFGCSGGNVSPALAWSNAPADTKSFALTMYDPDAPTGSGWWHWVVYNIPASATGLPAGAGSGAGLPAGALQGKTDFGSAGYGGPCPPKGDRPHRYIFTVYALKTDKLDVPADASPAMVGFMIHMNQVAKAKFSSIYGR